MAKSVGIPHRDHSDVSSRAKRAGMMGELGYVYHRGQRLMSGRTNRPDT
jgi:hypothetical protein